MTDLLNMLHGERASLIRKLAGVDAAIYAMNGSAAPAITARYRDAASGSMSDKPYGISLLQEK